ncbi:hypothetical protein F0M17_09210 [Glutamicibacter sp. ZJUTW]|nr:hypothetical protein F0M17_09210 [Glutamicibacter sp. ZJUTW]
MHVPQAGVWSHEVQLAQALSQFVELDIALQGLLEGAGPVLAACSDALNRFGAELLDARGDLVQPLLVLRDVFREFGCGMFVDGIEVAGV